LGGPRVSSGLSGHDRGNAPAPDRYFDEGENMIVLGLILLIIGFLAKIAILWTLGIILIVVGAILALLGGMGRAIGGRRHYY
jgi:hypothetical protein